MAGEPVITVVGNVAGDVDLRYAPSGIPVASWTVASTPRSKDKDSGNWVDGETLWVRCTAFRSDAENAAESFSKGTRVIVTGRLSQETWEDKSGNKRTTLKIMVEEAGASAKWSIVTPRKVERGSQQPKREAPVDDPWSSAPADSEPPF